MANQQIPDLESLSAHGRWVWALARSLVGDDQEADDVVQDTWVAALRRPPRATDSAGLRAWLARVARNFARKQAARGDLRSHSELEGAAQERLPSAEKLAPTATELAPTVAELTATTVELTSTTERLISPSEKVISLFKKGDSPTEKLISPSKKVISLSKKVVSPSENLSSPSKNVTSLFEKPISPSEKLISLSAGLISLSDTVVYPSVQGISLSARAISPASPGIPSPPKLIARSSSSKRNVLREILLSKNLVQYGQGLVQETLHAILQGILQVFLQVPRGHWHRICWQSIGTATDLDPAALGKVRGRRGKRRRRGGCAQIPARRRRSNAARASRRSRTRRLARRTAGSARCKPPGGPLVVHQPSGDPRGVRSEHPSPHPQGGEPAAASRDYRPPAQPGSNVGLNLASYYGILIANIEE